MPGLSKEQLKLLLSQVRDPALDPASLPCNLTLHRSIPQLELLLSQASPPQF